VPYTPAYQVQLHLISGAAVGHTWLHTPMRWEKQHARAILKAHHIAIAIGVLHVARS